MTVGVASSSASGYGTGSRGTSSGGGASVNASAKGDEDEGYSVSALRRQYTEFLQSKNSEIEEQRSARHYVHGDQLTQTQLATLQERGQPATIRDKLSRKINGIVGLLERMRQDPKAVPRNPEKPRPQPQQMEGMEQPEQVEELSSAEIATSVVRYVCDANNWQALSAEEARNGSINGLFGVEMDLVAGDQGDPDIGLAEIDNDTFFYDPRSFRYDFSDARYMGVAKWLDEDVAVEMFPDMEDEIKSLVTQGTGAESWQQRDRELKWTDSTRKRIFLVEHWYIRKGEWHGCWYCGDTKLKSIKSPFQDEKKKSQSRYIMASVNVDHDGDRYGYVRQLKTLIDELNALVSKRAHLINTRRIIMEEGAVSDVDKLRKEAVRADGVIIRNPGKELAFDDARTMADINSINEAIAEVKTEIENFGPNVAVLGQALENSSGKAIALLQQAGVAELGPFIIVYRDWKLRVYRAIWNAVRRHWTAERWIRVTDDDQSIRFMGLNVMQLGPDGQAMLTSIGPDGRPMAQGGVDALDVDIILDEGPDTLNVMQDTFETLQALATNGAQIPPDVLIMASNLPASEKKKILDKMEAAAKPKPFDEAVMRGKVEELQTDNDKTRAETAKIMAEVPGAAMAAAGAGPAGVPGAPPGPGGAAMPPVDPVAARDSDSKAEVAAAQAMSHRSTAFKNAADAAKTISETKAGAKAAEQTSQMMEQMAQLQAGLVQSVQQQADAISMQGEQMSRAIEEMARVLGAPKRIVTDGAGHPVGVETVGA